MPTIRLEDIQPNADGIRLIPAGYTLASDDDHRPPRTTTKKPTKRSKKSEASGDRFRVLNNFVDFSVGELTRAEVVCWLVLYRDTKDGLVKTAQTDIARRGGLSTRAVKTAMASLQRKRLVKLVRRGGLRQGPSIYRVRSLVK